MSGRPRRRVNAVDATRREVLAWLAVLGGAGFAGCGAERAPEAGEDAGPADASRVDAAAADAGRVDDAATDASLVDYAATDASAVDAAPTCAPTGSDVEGPFHQPGAPSRAALAGPDEPGTPLLMEGRVVDEDCQPVSDALLDLWQADTEGAYHEGEADAFRLRGQVRADADGRFAFTTIIPGRYALSGSFRPAHIHVIVERAGFVSLTTQLYFEGDPFLPPNDPCTGCNSEDPSLLVRLSPTERGQRGALEIVLRRA